MKVIEVVCSAYYVLVRMHTRCNPTFPGKKDKTRLMDGMVRLVVDSLGLQAPPAKGSDIVVGQECAATNRFLQLLALAAHSHRTHREKRQQARGSGDNDDNLRNQAWATQTAAAAKTYTVAVATSENGVTWEEAEFSRQGGSSGDETADADNETRHNGDGSHPLALTAATPTAARYLRLTWSAAESFCTQRNGKGAVATPSNPTLTTGAVATPAAPAFGPDYSTSEHGAEAGKTNTAVEKIRVTIVVAESGAEAPDGKSLVRGVAGGADVRNGEGESVRASRKEGAREARSEIRPRGGRRERAGGGGGGRERGKEAKT